MDSAVETANAISRCMGWRKGKRHRHHLWRDAAPLQTRASRPIDRPPRPTDRRTDTDSRSHAAAVGRGSFATSGNDSSLASRCLPSLFLKSRAARQFLWGTNGMNKQRRNKNELLLWSQPILYGLNPKEQLIVSRISPTYFQSPSFRVKMGGCRREHWQKLQIRLPCHKQTTPDLEG